MEKEAIQEQLKRRVIDLLFWLALLAIGLWAYESFKTKRTADELFSGQCAQIEEAARKRIEEKAVEKYKAELEEEK